MVASTAEADAAAKKRKKTGSRIAMLRNSIKLAGAFKKKDKGVELSQEAQEFMQKSREKFKRED